MKIDLIAGARPNLVKIASVSKELSKIKGFVVRIIYTGQHYDYLLSTVFFEELGIPKPYINLNAKGNSQSEITSSIMISYEKFLIKDPPNIVVVVGDVNSTLATAIVAKKMHLNLIHIESGLRSFDIRMPEEINRILTDSISDLHFVTSKYAQNNLISAGVEKNKIYFVGNTMIDTLINNITFLRKPSILNKKFKSFSLMTIHRPENVDDKKKLLNILNEISNSLKNYEFIFPVHPRTKNILFKSGVKFKNIHFIDPLPYHEFLFLVKKSLFVITDSGGVSEESTYFKTPCFTLRNSTERPETIDAGVNHLIGNSIKKIKKYLNNSKEFKIPNKWDGLASRRIAKKLQFLYLNKN